MEDSLQKIWMDMVWHIDYEINVILIIYLSQMTNYKKTLHAIILFLPNSINLVGFQVDLFFLNVKEYQNTLVGVGQFPTQYVHWNDCNGFFLVTNGHTETKIPAGSGVYLFSQYLTEDYVYEM